jgi:hypothetical protein
MNMDIRIKETGELKSLSIIDPQTGCNWEIDLMGNHDADMIYDDDEGVYIMDHETFDWWDDLLARYQTADYKLNETRCGVDNPESLDAYLVDMAVGSCELDNYPEALTAAINDWLDAR